MKWGLWSTTAASNSATPPDGWPEGQAPSTVNDCAREMMAQIRTGLNNLQFVDLGITPTETGNTTFTLAGNQMQWYPYGNRVQANVGGTLYYGTVISSTFTTNTGVTLRFDGGESIKLTNSLSAVATGYPSAVNGALPESVYRNRNYLRNPYFDIFQRGGGPFSFSSGVSMYTLDGWKLSFGIASAGPTAAVTIGERSAAASNVPTLAQAGVFLNNSLVVSCNAAVTGLGVADQVNITQIIEGWDFRQIAGKPTTLSFWVNSTVTGTYCVSVINAAGNQSEVLAYSISSAATWEKKTLTFTKTPSSGTWDYSFGVGLAVRFCLAAGSNFQGGAGNWTAANILATSSQTNFFAAANNSFKLTAAKFEEGSQTTPLDAVIYSEELSRNQRYLQIPAGRAAGFALGSTVALIDYPLVTHMRNQSLSVSVNVALTDLTILNAAASNLSVSAVTVLTTSSNRITVEVTPVGGAVLTAGQGVEFFASAGSKTALIFKSEL